MVAIWSQFIEKCSKPPVEIHPLHGLKSLVHPSKDDRMYRTSDSPQNAPSAYLNKILVHPPRSNVKRACVWCCAGSADSQPTRNNKGTSSSNNFFMLRVYPFRQRITYGKAYGITQTVAKCRLALARVFVQVVWCRAEARTSPARGSNPAL